MEIRVDDKYCIDVADGDVLGLTIPLSYRRKVPKHPAIQSTWPEVLEFKHYRKSGSKFWTSLPGVMLLILLPRDKAEILAEKTYSYPKIKVNGATLALSTCGCGSSEGWTDYITAINGTLVNPEATTINALLEVAIPKGDPRVAGLIAQLKPDDQRFSESSMENWCRLMAERTLFKHLTQGMRVTTIIGRKLKVESKYKGGRALLCRDQWNGAFRVGPQRIDWVETCRDNNLPYPSWKEYVS